VRRELEISDSRFQSSALYCANGNMRLEVSGSRFQSSAPDSAGGNARLENQGFGKGHRNILARLGVL